MPKAATNGVELEYELTGPEDGRPLLLVGGLGVQIISWTETFVAALADRGFRVTGSDLGAYPPMSDQLARLGIEVLKGFSPEHVRAEPPEIGRAHV